MKNNTPGNLPVSRGLFLNFNIMEFWALKACNFRCGYCGLVANGDVTDNSHSVFYKDIRNRQAIETFFNKVRPSGRPWAVLMTGGEPFLVPELDDLVGRLGKGGNSVAFYTNMSVPIAKALSSESMQHVGYIQASFHPDWHMAQREKTQFFANVEEIKRAGIPVLVRFVGAKFLLFLLPELAAICKELDVCFLVTTCFDEEYPKAYTQEEYNILAGYMAGYSSLLQLDGGLDMSLGRRCEAGSRLFATRFHEGFDITPCVSTGGPVLGNILANTLKPVAGPMPCFDKNKLCTCDIHFQQNLIEEARDAEKYYKQLNGFCESVTLDEYENWKNKHALKTTSGIHVQGKLVKNFNSLILK